MPTLQPAKDYGLQHSWIWQPEKTRYPDANSTMRLTYGSVQDYDPKDAVTYKYYTTLQGASG